MIDLTIIITASIICLTLIIVVIVFKWVEYKKEKTTLYEKWIHESKDYYHILYNISHAYEHNFKDIKDYLENVLSAIIDINKEINKK